MSIQRAEELKREWTDRYVVVKSNTPELRRFAGLTGCVKTVNMNCRLLVQFDGPADISWYDIDPRYVSVTDPPAASSDTTSTPTDQPIDTPQAKATGDTPVTSPVGSPLDQIRKQGAGLPSGPAASEVATPTNPLDAIRKQAAGSPATKTKRQAPDPDHQESTVPSDDTKASSGNPLDLIRQQAAKSAGSAAEPNPHDSQPVQTSDTSSTVVTEPAEPPHSGSQPSATNPLDQIRQQHAGSRPTAAISESAPAEHDSGADIAPQEADLPQSSSAATEVATADTKPAEQRDSLASATTDDASDTPAATSPLAASPAAAAVPPPAVDSGSPLDQIRRQASEDGRDVAGTDSLFEQVQRQAASDQPVDKVSTREAQTEAATPPDAANNTGSMTQQSLFAANLPTGAQADGVADGATGQYAGREDPVKATFRGKKLPKTDDLKIVEGIGPKISELFHDNGIATWLQLSEADPARLREILEEAGSRFRMHNPDTWPTQARLAHEGKWQQLEEYQDHLDGGREPGQSN